MGGSGGGGGSGEVSYPQHIEEWHADVLGWSVGMTDFVVAGETMADVMIDAIGSSPFNGETVYDPSTELAAMLTASGLLQTLTDLISSGTGLDTAVSTFLSDSRIEDAVDAFEADLDSRLTNEVLPRFQAGMRDINAVMSSAFVIGQSLIEQNQDRQVAQFDANLRNKLFSDDLLQLMSLKAEMQKNSTHMAIEANRMNIVGYTEEDEANFELEKKDALWDLEVFQYGANMLAAPGGGTSLPADNSPSTMQKALGGALSGAAAGGMLTGMNPAGMAIGGILGAASAFL